MLDPFEQGEQERRADLAILNNHYQLLRQTNEQDAEAFLRWWWCSATGEDFDDESLYDSDEEGGTTSSVTSSRRGSLGEASRAKDGANGTEDCQS
jgi:hypothetical protein